MLPQCRQWSDSNALTVCRDELAVVACSALKQRYRDILSGCDQGSKHVEEVAFVSMSCAQTLYALIDLYLLFF